MTRCVFSAYWSHDVETALHAARASDSECGRITLLHILLLRPPSSFLLKHISITAIAHSFLWDPVGMLSLPPCLLHPTCHESQPNFISHSNDRRAGWLCASWLKMNVGLSCAHLSRTMAKTAHQRYLTSLPPVAVQFKLTTSSATHTNTHQAVKSAQKEIKQSECEWFAKFDKSYQVKMRKKIGFKNMSELYLKSSYVSLDFTNQARTWTEH